jgi:hypothetical protein
MQTRHQSQAASGRFLPQPAVSWGVTRRAYPIGSRGRRRLHQGPRSARPTTSAATASEKNAAQLTQAGSRVPRARMCAPAAHRKYRGVAPAEAAQLIEQQQAGDQLDHQAGDYQSAVPVELDDVTAGLPMIRPTATSGRLPLGGPPGRHQGEHLCFSFGTQRHYRLARQLAPEQPGSLGSDGQTSDAARVAQGLATELLNPLQPVTDGISVAVQLSRRG